MPNRKIIWSILSLVTVLGLFILISTFAQSYENEIRALVEVNGFAGMMAYVLISALAIVVAPISTLPLIPLATSLWGWIIAGLLSIVGWVIGAQVAFHLARRFGRPLVQRIVSPENISKFENRLPEKNLFWTVTFLRIVVPVDVLSYAVGLFTKMRSLPYFLTTIIGVTPFAFVFAYAGTFSARLQVMIALEVLAIAVVALLFKKIDIKKILLAVVLLMVSITAIFYRVELLSSIQHLESVSASSPISAALVLILLKTVLAPIGFPGTPLTLISGSLFGSFVGTVVALIGNTLGATLAFLLARYILKDYVQKVLISKYPRIREYEQKLESKALTTIIAMRLIPIFPFNVLNFLLGVSNVTFRQYVIGSFIGMIPGTALFVYFGQSLRMFSILNIIIAVVGIFILIKLGRLYESRF